MATHLLTVDDVFNIEGRGLIVVPGPLKREWAGPQDLDVRLRSPSGDEKSASLRLTVVFQTPPPVEDRWVCILTGVTKSEVPIGTEVWVETPGPH